MARALLALIIATLVFTIPIAAPAHAGTDICGSLDAGNVGPVILPYDGTSPDRTAEQYVLDAENPQVGQMLEDVGIGRLVRLYDPIVEAGSVDVGYDKPVLVSVLMVVGFSRY